MKLGMCTCALSALEPALRRSVNAGWFLASPAATSVAARCLRQCLKLWSDGRAQKASPKLGS
eukprot:14235803-Alexandrium_andersonii.AAC.1